MPFNEENISHIFLNEKVHIISDTNKKSLKIKNLLSNKIKSSSLKNHHLL